MLIPLLFSVVLNLEAPFGKYDITVPEFGERTFSVVDYGAKPNGEKCTDAFAAAMAACEKSGGGSVVVPPGKWLTGAVHFRNNCNLHLSEGAVLEFTDDPADYPEVHTTWEGIECYNHSPLLFAYGVTNIAITGSDCPGEDCVHSGWIKASGRSIVCLPNKVEIRIVGQSDDVDFVVG